MSHEKAKESLPFVTNVPGSCVKFSEGAEACCEAWAWMFLLFRHFGPFWAIGTYGQVDMKSLVRGGGLTLDDIGHLLRPLGCICIWVIECC